MRGAVWGQVLQESLALDLVTKVPLLSRGSLRRSLLLRNLVTGFLILHAFLRKRRQTDRFCTAGASTSVDPECDPITKERIESPIRYGGMGLPSQVGIGNAARVGCFALVLPMTFGLIV